MLCDVVRGCYSCSQLSWLRRHTKCWQTGHINSSHPVHSKASQHPKLRWSALQTSAISLEVNMHPTKTDKDMTWRSANLDTPTLARKHLSNLEHIVSQGLPSVKGLRIFEGDEWWMPLLICHWLIYLGRLWPALASGGSPSQDELVQQLVHPAWEVQVDKKGRL